MCISCEFIVWRVQSYGVYFDGNSSTIVLNAYNTILPIHHDLDILHTVVSLLVVGSIDQYFVENLVKTRNKRYFAKLHLARF